MSIASILQTLGIKSVPLVPPAPMAEGTGNPRINQECSPCSPCSPEKHRKVEQERQPERRETWQPGQPANPDALLLEIAQTLEANPARLRAMMSHDDVQAAATGESSRAYLLEFFRLKQQTGELLADHPQPPGSKALGNQPGHMERMKAWKPAHESMIDHVMACTACYAPKHRYCEQGAGLHRAYHDAYQSAVNDTSRP